MVKVNNTENPADFSFCKEMFEKFGARRLIGWANTLRVLESDGICRLDCFRWFQILAHVF